MDSSQLFMKHISIFFWNFGTFTFFVDQWLERLKKTPKYAPKLQILHFTSRVFLSVPQSSLECFLAFLRASQYSLVFLRVFLSISQCSLAFLSIPQRSLLFLRVPQHSLEHSLVFLSITQCSLASKSNHGKLT